MTRTKSFDPITLEVLRNRMEIIADEMQAAMIRSAFSNIIKEGGDCGVAIFDAKGGLIAHANALPANLGILNSSVARVLEDYPADGMEDGDAYCFNDPYEGGTHIPDVAMIVPIVWEGRTIALSAVIAHQQDFGGMTLGSLPPDSTEIFQEGLVLPPCRLIHRGRWNKEVLGIILKNIRMPDHTMGDFRAELAAGDVGRRRFLETVAEYGIDTLLAYIDELNDRAERQARAKIEEIPDGVYDFVDYLDNDGIDLDVKRKIQCTVTVAGSNMTFDFSGTDPQLRGASNSAVSGPISCCYYVAHCIYGEDVPNNEGCYRPLTVHVPKGTLLNPEHPAALNSRTMTVLRAVDTAFGSLMRVIPQRLRASSGGMEGVTLAGRRPDGSAYVYLELFAAGMGARPTKDGIEYIECDTTNMLNTPVEALELDYPVRIHQLLLRQDGGGAGRFRGGTGIVKEFEILDETTEISHRGDRFVTQPWGLFGGRPGASWETTVTRTDGEVFKVPSRKRFKLGKGDRMVCAVAGGGGYGDPLDREPEAVAADVRDRKVSPTQADEVYGVVLTKAGTVDGAATESRRAALKAAAGPIDWTFDRGALGTEA
ncbi:hydantoinase B/oxoprolinase family protein [Consotaella aegiceratis]|uniref:hydantoinase B/oxoprolinase family protein n=1 Tax=Consotaella aegiceratis TaxID=3097961 RepID=UPI002F42A336